MSDTKIGDREMARQTRYRDYVIPDGVTEIGKEAFMDSMRLHKIYIPKSVAVIGRDAFRGCGNLEIYCEDAPQEGWVYGMRKETVSYEIVTPEDDAFNFHRSGGSFTSTTVYREEEVFCDWNPDGRPVHTHVPKEETANWITPEDEARAAREEQERLEREREQKAEAQALYDRRMRIFLNGDVQSQYTRKAIKELLRENPQFKKVDFFWLYCSDADDFEKKCVFTRCPSAFCGWKKLYEPSENAHLSEIKEGLAQAFRDALEEQRKQPKD